MKLHMYMLEASIESVSMFEWRAATLAPMCSFHSFLVLLKVIGAKKVLYFFTGFFSAYKKIAVLCGKKLHNSYWNNATCFKLLPFHLKKFYRLVFTWTHWHVSGFPVKSTYAFSRFIHKSVFQSSMFVFGLIPDQIKTSTTALKGQGFLFLWLPIVFVTKKDWKRLKTFSKQSIACLIAKWRSTEAANLTAVKQQFKRKKILNALQCWIRSRETHDCFYSTLCKLTGR